MEKQDLASQAIVFGLEPDPRVEAILGVDADDGERDLDHRARVNDRGAHSARPVLGRGNRRSSPIAR